jgi:hypothetical protein
VFTILCMLLDISTHYGSESIITILIEQQTLQPGMRDYCFILLLKMFKINVVNLNFLHRRMSNICNKVNVYSSHYQMYRFPFAESHVREMAL